MRQSNRVALKEIALRRPAEQYQEDEVGAFAVEALERISGGLRKLVGLGLEEIEIQVSNMIERVEPAVASITENIGL